MSYQDALLTLTEDYSLLTMDAASPVNGIDTCGDSIPLGQVRELGTGTKLELLIECTETCTRSASNLASVQFMLVGASDALLTTDTICYCASMPLGVASLASLPKLGEKFVLPLGIGYKGGIEPASGTVAVPGTANGFFGRAFLGVKAINYARALSALGTAAHTFTAGKFRLSLGLAADSGSRVYPGAWGIR